MNEIKSLTINGKTYGFPNKTAVKTINGETPDENGNIQLEVGGGANNPIARIDEVTLFANAWVGNDDLYSQVVAIDGVTEKDQVDLTPSVEQLEIFYEKDLTLTTKNSGGTVTVYAIGQKPTNGYTIQVTITEVAYSGDIYGVTVGTPLRPQKIIDKTLEQAKNDDNLATKEYVDEEIETIRHTAATQQYVDNLIGNVETLLGGI